MPTAIRRKAGVRRRPRAKTSVASKLTAEELALENAISAAAARDLAARPVVEDAADLALVNAVARAAARSLAS